MTVSLVKCGEARPGSSRVKQVNPSTADIRDSKPEAERTAKEFVISNNVIPARYFLFYSIPISSIYSIS